MAEITEVREGTFKATLAFFEQQGTRLGDLDLILTDRDGHTEIVLAVLGLLLSAVTESGSPQFDRVRLILPEGVTWNVEGSLKRLLNRRDPGVAWGRTDIVTTTNRGIDALVSAAANAPDGTAVVCGFVDLFGSAQAPTTVPDATTEGLMGEQLRLHRFERWMAHELTSLGSTLRSRLQAAKKIYVLCVSSHGPLGEFVDELSQAYNAIGILGVPNETPESMKHLEEWATALQEGVSLDEVRNRIAEAVGDDNAEVTQVLAIALSMADRPVPAFETFSRYLQKRSGSVEAGIVAMGARFALEAGKQKDAAVLVQQVLDDSLAGIQALKAVVQVARNLDDADLGLRAATLLQQRVPNDALGLMILAEQLLRTGRAQEVVTLLVPHVDSLDDAGKYFLALASHRAGTSGGLAGFFDKAPASMRQLAVAGAIQFGAKRQAWEEVDEAIKAIVADDSHKGEIVRALCFALERWALSPKPPQKEKSSEEVKDDELIRPRHWLQTAVAILASRPEDVENRLRLEEVVGPEGVGEIVALALLLPLVRTPATTHECDPPPSLQPGTDEEQDEFVAFYNEFARDRTRILLVPKRLIAEPPSATQADRLLRGGAAILDVASQQVGEDDKHTVTGLVESLLDIVHTNYDVATPRGAALAVALVHVAITGLALRGQLQVARNLVETIMHIAGGTEDPAVHAYAWLALADVRLRGHQPRQALLQIALASRTLPTGPSWEGHYRAYTTRLMRDLGGGFIKEAWEEFDTLSRIALVQPAVVGPNQLRELKWSLALVSGARPFRTESLPDAEIAALVEVVTETFDMLGKDLAPWRRTMIAAYLAQATRILSDHAHAPPIEISALRARIESSGMDPVGGLGGLIAETPTVDHLRKAVERSVAPRYADDLVQDAWIARMVARRILESSSIDMAARAVALEVISDLEAGFQEAGPFDQGVTHIATTRAFERARENKPIEGLAELLTPSVNVAGRHDRLQKVLENPGEFLKRLKERGRDGVLFEATAIVGNRLGYLRVAGGEAAWTVEPPDVFDPQRIWPYARTYPYAYHEMNEQSLNPEHDVAETLQGLGVSPISSSLSLRCVAPDHRLLPIPANLQIVGDIFAGDLTPTCQVPSLGWLIDRRESGIEPVPWSATAWVLRESESEFLAPLTIGAEELTDQLEPFGVQIRRDVALADVAVSPVMWLVAHGGLGVDKRHFARVSDDRDTLHQPGDLVRACSGAALVVLLVCSGGRGSHELFAERVRGLPAELLRRGVRTVVASPWPLDVLVGTKWSGAFAKALRGGVTVARAAYDANKTLAGRHPKDRLAMHVYGDPWLGVSL